MCSASDFLIRDVPWDVSTRMFGKEIVHSMDPQKGHGDGKKKKSRWEEKNIFQCLCSLKII